MRMHIYIYTYVDVIWKSSRLLPMQVKVRRTNSTRTLGCYREFLALVFSPTERSSGLLCFMALEIAKTKALA